MSSELQSSLMNGTLVANYKFDEIRVRKIWKAFSKNFILYVPILLLLRTIIVRRRELIYEQM